MIVLILKYALVCVKALSFVCMRSAIISCAVVLVLMFGRNTLQAQAYFRTIEGIPYIPVLAGRPATASEGAVYVDSGDKKIHWFVGGKWVTSPAVVVSTPVATITSPAGKVKMNRNFEDLPAVIHGIDYQVYSGLSHWCLVADWCLLAFWNDSMSGEDLNGNTTNLRMSTFTPNPLFVANNNSD